MKKKQYAEPCVRQGPEDLGTLTFTIHNIENRKVQEEEDFIIDRIFSGAWDDQLEMITSNMFEDESNAKLFGYAMDLHLLSLPINLESLLKAGHKLSEEEQKRITNIPECYNESWHLKYHVKILRHLYIMRRSFQIGMAINALFNDNEDINDFLSEFSSLAAPLVKLAGKAEEEQRKEYEVLLQGIIKKFTPHDIVKGEERYKVLQSKFDPSEGYVWVNGKAIAEKKMLQKGFVIEEPES